MIYDLSSHAAAIPKQGHLKTCAQCSLSYLLQLKANLIGKPIEPISRLQSYTDTRVYQGDIGKDDGSKLGFMLLAAKEIGLAPEAMWPYDEGLLFKRPPHPVYKEAKRATITGYRQVSLEPFFITENIKNGHPLLLNLEWPNHSWAHVVTIVGVDTTARKFKLANSHGSYDEISYHHYKQRVNQVYKINGFKGENYE